MVQLEILTARLGSYIYPIFTTKKGWNIVYAIMMVRPNVIQLNPLIKNFLWLNKITSGLGIFGQNTIFMSSFVQKERINAKCWNGDSKYYSSPNLLINWISYYWLFLQSNNLLVCLRGYQISGEFTGMTLTAQDKCWIQVSRYDIPICEGKWSNTVTQKLHYTIRTISNSTYLTPMKLNVALYNLSVWAL